MCGERSVIELLLHPEGKLERQQKQGINYLSTKQLITLMFISLEARATFETTPVVMVLERLSGEPMATTNSPGRRSLEDPKSTTICGILNVLRQIYTVLPNNDNVLIDDFLLAFIGPPIFPHFIHICNQI